MSTSGSQASSSATSPSPQWTMQSSRQYPPDTAFFRPVDPTELVGDASRARAVLGWEPTVAFEEIVARMVAADLG